MVVKFTPRAAFAMLFGRKQEASDRKRGRSNPQSAAAS